MILTPSGFWRGERGLKVLVEEVRRRAVGETYRKQWNGREAPHFAADLFP
jgi:hypothetical protein